MKKIATVNQMHAFADEARRAGRTIGLVPTMGYFHAGHLSLMRIARERADVVVTSLFVNPAQFAPNEDLDVYPRAEERDWALAEEVGVDVMFMPGASEMYPKGYQTQVTVPELGSGRLCAITRPHFFGGVATVCAKLFACVKPHFAVFGEKDWQQLQVIRRMVLDLNLDLEIVAGPLVREEDGLAMSSRNALLLPEKRVAAREIHRGLLAARDAYRAGERDARALERIVADRVADQPELRLDYATVSDAWDLFPVEGAIDRDAVLAVAVFAGETRLIDNLLLN